MRRKSEHRRGGRTAVTETFLNGFANRLEDSAAALSMARLMLNLPIYMDEYGTGPDGAGDADEAEGQAALTKRFFALLRDGFGVGPAEEPDGAGELPCWDADRLHGAAERILALREDNIRRMHVLNAYADRFTIYEYVLNRIEYRFVGGALPSGYSDEDMAQQILSSLSRISDQTAKQSMLAAVIEQLPVRMTKKRFFEILSNGINAYSGSDRETVDNLMFLLRTAAMLDAPETVGAGASEMDCMIREFNAADLVNIEAKTHAHLVEQLGRVMEELDGRMDRCLLLQELLNDLAVVSLLPQDAFGADSLSCAGVVSYLAAQERVDEALLAEKLAALEGIQEKAASSYSSLSASLPEYTEGCSEELAAWGLADRFSVLEQCTRLLSGSRFASLQAAETRTVEPEYLEQVTEELLESLSASFASHSRLVNRAVMAKLVTMLPLFLRDFQQLEEYIRSSLSGCTDPAEKLGCIEIINELIAEQVSGQVSESRDVT